MSEGDERDDYVAEIVQQERDEERESEPPCVIKPVESLPDSDDEQIESALAEKNETVAKSNENAEESDVDESDGESSEVSESSDEC